MYEYKTFNQHKSHMQWYLNVKLFQGLVKATNGKIGKWHVSPTHLSESSGLQATLLNKKLWTLKII